RDETRRRNSHRETGAGVSGDVERDAGRRLADAGSFSIRRQHPGQRCLDANCENGRRQLSRRGLFFAAMKTRRTKRKMATRKKFSRVRSVIVREQKPLNYRVALPPAQRRLRFGDRWDYAPAPE